MICVSFVNLAFVNTIFDLINLRGILAVLCISLGAVSAFGQPLKWKAYNTENSDIPHNHILSLAMDHTGKLWMGTNWGLVKYDGNSFIKYDKKSDKDVQYTTVRSITVDSANAVWTGTWGDGMARLKFPNGDRDNPDAQFKWVNYRENNSAITHNTVKTICIDTKGNRWIGTEEGLVLMSTAEWGEAGVKWKSYFAFSSGLPHDAVHQIVVDKFNNKWIGTFGGGIAKFDGMNWTVYDIKNSDLPDNYIVSMAIDKKQVLWIGTYSGGLARFDGTTWTVYNTTNSGLHDNVVYSLAVDSQNKLWLGSMNAGLASFDGTNWKTYRIMDSSDPYTVSSIVIDSKNNKWLGTGGGVVVFNERGIK